MPERHIKAIEKYFNLSLCDNKLPNNDKILSIKLKKGQILHVEYDD